MTALRAARRSTDAFDEDLRASFRRAAARSGTLHATPDLVVATVGVARVVELPFGVGDATAPSDVADALSSIDVTGDGGPGGSGVLGVGALPFDPEARTGLSIPSIVCTWRPGAPRTWVTHVVAASATPDPLDAALSIAKDSAPAVPCGEVAEREERPTAADYAQAVAAALERIAAGDVEKVVLARSVVGRTTGPIDPARLAGVLAARDPGCTLYAYPAGPGRFVGASPELIVATEQGHVRAHPLAGTVALLGDADDDDRVAWLQGDEKNRREHAIVVEDVLAGLQPLCDAIVAAAGPTVVRLSTDARLGTEIEGTLSGPGDVEAAMAVLGALHPTPAVGGRPAAAARSLIASLEHAPRGPWAGAVGWVDADGTSCWTLALRGIRLQQDRFEAWGGAGIVAGSVPEAEAAETGAKLDSVLRVLVD